MATRSLEERLAGVRRWRAALPDPAPVSELRKLLSDRSNLLVAAAAEVAGRHGVHELKADLLATFDRLFDDGERKDPKCQAKTAIAQALVDLDHDESAAFLRGAAHTQWEPVWGGREDTAATLRAVCLLALPQCSDLSRANVFRRLVDALVDPVVPVRRDVLRGIAGMGGDEAALLLRAKVRIGDADPSVMGQAFDGLIELEGDRAIGVVREYAVGPPGGLREEAVLSLGTCRSPAAVPVLATLWNQMPDPDFRSVIARALAASGRDDAIEFLLQVVRTGLDRDSRAAIEALRQLGRPGLEERLQSQWSSRA